MLAPYLDLLNHSSDAVTTAQLDTATRTFRLVTQRAQARGRECFISYGPHDDAFLLAEYGFAIGAGVGDPLATMKELADLTPRQQSQPLPPPPPPPNPYDHVVVDDEFFEVLESTLPSADIRKVVIDSLADAG
ncbi:SET domain-containing protein 4, partial [Cladochytrium tenue]